MFLTELFAHWTYRVFAPGALLRQKYDAFKALLAHDRRSLELIAELEELAHAEPRSDWARAEGLIKALRKSVAKTAQSLRRMSPTRYMDLDDYRRKIDFYLELAAAPPEIDGGPPHVLSLDEAWRRPDLAGGKACGLSEVRVGSGLTVPDGFVITANAFQYVLEYNDLRERQRALLRGVRLDAPRGSRALTAVADRLRRLILEADLPPALEQTMAEALARRVTPGALLAVRSSALGEDSEASFAGQYATELNVPPQDLNAAYRRVLASKYSPQALAYRVRQGLSDAETPMAVLVMPMVDASASGVIYTRDPVDPSDARVGAVYAVPGLGEGLVDGSLAPDVFSFRRSPEGARLLGACHGETCHVGGAPEGALCLAEAEALALAEAGLRLEALRGSPQDVEWSRDRSGRLFILQSRPLGLTAAGDAPAPLPEAELPEPLALGVRASPGVGAGPVWPLAPGDDLDLIPPGAVLVTRGLTPELSRVLDRLAAVAAEAGSRASHFASVAREAGLPVLTGVQSALARLPAGIVVTVDAGRGAIYPGRLPSPPAARPDAAPRPDTPFNRRLQALLPLAATLNLTDPASPNFKPAGCKSMHDVVRFCHEKSVAEMFSLVDRGGRGLARAREFQTDLPFVLRVLDLDGGLTPDAPAAGAVRPEHVASQPMRAVWAGLSDPSVTWRSDRPHFDWSAFDQVDGGGFVNPRSASLSSYAVLSRDYLHCLVRFGFHFAVVDALCGEEPEANHVRFRFKGGGAAFENRLRRLGLIAWLLEEAGFKAQTKGDMLDAVLARLPRSDLLPRLRLIGLILARTRLLDMAMEDEARADEAARELKSRLDEWLGEARDPARGAGSA